MPLADPGAALASAPIDRRQSAAETSRTPAAADRLLENWANDRGSQRQSPEDDKEAGLQRRARHQALLLLTVSTAISLALLYGLWALLRGFL